MKTTCSFIFIFIFKIIVGGQNDSIRIYKNQIKISPFRLITEVRGLEISFERQYLNKHSTQLSTAYIFDPFSKTKFSTRKKLRGFSLGVEQKYFIDKMGYTATYLSTDYKISSYTFEDIALFGYKSPKDSVEYAYQYLDTFNIRKTTQTLCVRLGVQLIHKHLILDLNIGIGIRYRSVIHSNRFNSDDFMQTPRHPNIEYMNTVNGNYFVPSLPMALKLGYIF
jgi:hypothetical protein